MKHQRGARRAAVKKAAFQHIQSAAENLLGALKHEANPAGKRTLAFQNKLCREKEHCRVHIVSAGVHIAVFCTKGKTAALGDGERVCIRAQQNIFLALADVGNNAASANPFWREPERP